MVELKLGMNVKDNVTGAVGTITAIEKYFNIAKERIEKVA